MYRHSMKLGGGEGREIHAENLPPTYPQIARGAKRVLDENYPAPSAKRRDRRVKDLKNVQSIRTLEPHRGLKMQNINTMSTYKRPYETDTLEKIRVSDAGRELVHPVQNLSLSPARKKPKGDNPYTNFTMDIRAAGPLDYYVAKCDLPTGVPDIDRDLIEDPNCEAQYAHDVFTYLRARERLFIVESYIHKQPDVSPLYRALLVDWMVELQEIFELNHEALYLAVKIVDLYLSRRFTPKAEVQLLGATAMLVASKIGERTPPAIGDFVSICNKARSGYDRASFIAMERQVLATLDFDLSIPLSYSFLRRFCRSIGMDMREMTLARFILECSLMEYSLVGVPESHVAAASLLLALEILGRRWNDTLTYYTGYEAGELIPVRNMLNRLVHELKRAFAKNSNSARVIVDKYSHEVFYKVAEMEFPPIDG
ncbi:cyclin B3-like [Tropilaelaps mercedesae]|uniref:Cyclin B3-like n=1 Tax=Tropilaelaps mercedesae TaxID=418985 RepID=A0A1V9XW87_9ACAR|nr:cyclin B3-like [Tropilaelaps mercedesae]